MQNYYLHSYFNSCRKVYRRIYNEENHDFEIIKQRRKESEIGDIFDEIRCGKREKLNEFSEKRREKHMNFQTFLTLRTRTSGAIKAQNVKKTLKPSIC